MKPQPIHRKPLSRRKPSREDKVRFSLLQCQTIGSYCSSMLPPVKLRPRLCCLHPINEKINVISKISNKNTRGKYYQVKNIFIDSTDPKKQNIQFLFLAQFFYALSSGVVHFLLSISSRNHLLNGQMLQQPMKSFYLGGCLRGYNFEQNEPHHEKGIRKLFHFVLFHHGL